MEEAFLWEFGGGGQQLFGGFQKCCIVGTGGMALSTLLSGLSYPGYSWDFFAGKKRKKGTVPQDLISIGLYFFLRS